jgi:hypothetical protein
LLTGGLLPSGDSRTVLDHLHERRFSAIEYGIEFGAPPLNPNNPFRPPRAADPETELVVTWNTDVRSVRRYNLPASVRAPSCSNGDVAAAVTCSLIRSCPSCSSTTTMAEGRSW